MCLSALGGLLTVPYLVVKSRQITLDVGVCKPHQATVEVGARLVVDIAGKARHPVCKMVAHKVPLRTAKLILLRGVAMLDCLCLFCREERHKLQWQEGSDYFASLVMGSKNV